MTARTDITTKWTAFKDREDVLWAVVPRARLRGRFIDRDARVGVHAFRRGWAFGPSIINEIIDRLNTEKLEGRDLDYKLSGTPKDLGGAEQLFESTKAQNHKPFEQRAVSLAMGRWNDKHGADRGVDGRLHLWDLQATSAKPSSKSKAATP